MVIVVKSKFRQFFCFHKWAVVQNLFMVYRICTKCGKKQDVEIVRN